MAPSPFIYWGQNATTLFLRIALRDVEKDPEIGLTHEEITFRANGKGAHGDCRYEFNILPYLKIAPQKSRLRITGSDVLLEIWKGEPTTKENPWPRLTKDTTKRPWIKPDFDRMDISEDEDEQLLEKKNREKMEKEYLQKITGDLELEHEKAIQDMKTTYLFSYSLFQLLAFTFILLKTVYGLCLSLDYVAYHDVGTVLVICQWFSFLEILHPMIGLIKTSFVPPLIQTCGRNLILLVLIWNEPRLHELRATTYLILFWSLADVIRHTFYMVNSMDLKLYIVTWLRYTMWIPLYPLGAGCEWLVTWYAIPMYVESQRFSIGLPNWLNFSFSLTSYLYLHLVVLPTGLFMLMKHMASLRRKKLGGGKPANKNLDKKTN